MSAPHTLCITKSVGKSRLKNAAGLQTLHLIAFAAHDGNSMQISSCLHWTAGICKLKLLVNSLLGAATAILCLNMTNCNTSEWCEEQCRCWLITRQPAPGSCGVMLQTTTPHLLGVTFFTNITPPGSFLCHYLVFISIFLYLYSHWPSCQFSSKTSSKISSVNFKTGIVVGHEGEICPNYSGEEKPRQDEIGTAKKLGSHGCKRQRCKINSI